MAREQKQIVVYTTILCEAHKGDKNAYVYGCTCRRVFGTEKADRDETEKLLPPCDVEP